MHHYSHAHAHAHPRRASRPLARWLCALVLLGAATAASAAPTAAEPATTWTAGPGATGDASYDGYVDAPANGATVGLVAPFQVSGWVVDKTAQGWAGVDGVQVFLGTMDGGGTRLASALVAQSRPDVATALGGDPTWAASGFTANVGTAGLVDGPATLTVYAHTPNKGWWYRQVNVTFARLSYLTDPIHVIVSPRLREDVVGQSSYTVSGYALDRNAPPNQGSGIDRVQVYRDGDRDYGVYLGEATLGIGGLTPATYGAQFARAGYQMTASLNGLATGPHDFSIYARSAVSGRETLSDVSFTTSD